LLRHLHTGILHRLPRRHETEVRVTVVTAGLLRVHVLGGFPIAHLGTDLTGEVAGIEK
jgi:hypothetical protein